MSKTSSERFGISAAAGLSTTPDGVEAPKFGEDSFSSGRFKSSGGDGTTINIYTAEPNPDATDDEKDDDGTTGTKAGSVSGSFEEDSSESSTSSSSSAFDSFSRSKSESEAASKIASKKIRITEVNIGGLPSTDWREWAASVKQKPMPISYDLVGIWNLMDNALAESFFEAYMHMEALKTLRSDSGPYLDAMHFGVSRGSGEPLSTYSSDPNVDFRALLRVDQIEANVSEETEDLVVVGENFQPIVDRPLGTDLFACGIQVARDYNKDTSLGNKIGVEALFARFCSASNWLYRSGWLQIGQNSADQNTKDAVPAYYTKNPRHSSETIDCPDNQFIDGMRVRYCTDSSCASLETEDVAADVTTNSIDALGISGIQISCNELGGSEFTRTIQEVFCLDQLDRNETQTDCRSDSSWGDWKFLPPTDSTDTTNVIVGASIEQGPQKGNTPPRSRPVGLKGKSLDAGGIAVCLFVPLYSIFGNCDEDDLNRISDEDLAHNAQVKGAFNEQWKAFSEKDDDLGVVGVKFLYKEVPIAGSGFANSAISYSATWKGKGTRPAAVFATPIRGNEGKSSEEESSYSFQKLQDQIPSYLGFFEQQQKYRAYSDNLEGIVEDFLSDMKVDITRATFDEYVQATETKMRNNLQELFNEYVLVNNVTVEEALNNATILELEYLQATNITREADLTNTTLAAFDDYLQANSIPVNETLIDTTNTAFNEFLQAKNFAEEEIPTLLEYRQNYFNFYLPFDEYVQATEETKMTTNLQELFNEYVLVNNVTVEEALNNATILELEYLQATNVTREADLTNTTLVAFDYYLQANSIPVNETLTNITNTAFNEFLQAKNFTEEEIPTLLEYRQILFNIYLEENNIVIEEPPPNETKDKYLQRILNQDTYSISLVNNIPFGLSDDHNSPGVIAMSNFGQQVRTNSHLLNNQHEVFVS